MPVLLLNVAALIPVILAVMHPPVPDLFELTPKSARMDGFAVIAWHDLERSPGTVSAEGLPSGGPALALGYMADAGAPIPSGRAIRRFVLLPHTGTAFHPAHRLRDQMIEVQLKDGEDTAFVEGELVWVWGTWQVMAGSPDRAKPLYQLSNARVERADRAEISRYFR